MTDRKVQHVDAPWGWIPLAHPEPSVMEIHLLPIADVRGHAFDDECPCHPVETSSGFFSHNAFDQRELYETGARKAH